MFVYLWRTNVGSERKLTVKHPDGRVYEVPITDEEFREMVLGGMSGKSAITDSHRTKNRARASSADVFPTDEQLGEVLKDGDKTVNELAQHFFKRKINSHKDSALYHRLYGAKKRVQEARTKT